jgi:hypothetical protein
MAIVRHETADEWRRFLRDDPARGEGDVRPKTFERRERVTGARYDEEQRR